MDTEIIDLVRVRQMDLTTALSNKRFNPMRNQRVFRPQRIQRRRGVRRHLA
jgi:hypothetical protein